MAAWSRANDPSRPLHYEGSLFVAWGQFQGRAFEKSLAERCDLDVPASDVIAPMYPGIDELDHWAKTYRGDKPLIMCEYSHAMGNSNGSLKDYWDLIEVAARTAGRLHLGLGRPGLSRTRRRRTRVLRFRRRLWRLTERRELLLQRRGVARSHAASGHLGTSSHRRSRCARGWCNARRCESKSTNRSDFVDSSRYRGADDRAGRRRAGRGTTC